MIEQYLNTIQNNVNLEDGQQVIKNILINIYMKQGISNKELARNNFLPIPVVVAIKKEFIKINIVKQDRGIRTTEKGTYLVEKEIGFSGLNQELYLKLNEEGFNKYSDIFELKDSLTEIYENRPIADVTIDQTKCTIDTAIKRALLSIKKGTLIGSNILCVGDDDLVSIALGFILKKLYVDMSNCRTTIQVLDIDNRIINYIEDISFKYKLPIKCKQHDLRLPFLNKERNYFDCLYTDPPYTLEGLNLFLSRGIEALKKNKGQTIFLSFSHKSLAFNYEMQKIFMEMGLIIAEILPSFNTYEGAGIIGNKGQLIILTTTTTTKGLISTTFNNPIYTREVKRMSSK